MVHCASLGTMPQGHHTSLPTALPLLSTTLDLVLLLVLPPSQFERTLGYCWLAFPGKCLPQVAQAVSLLSEWWLFITITECVLGRRAV